MTKPTIPPLAGKLYRVAARAANRPKQVDKTATETAIKTELRVASTKAWVVKTSMNQPKVKPCNGKAMTVPELKANNGKSTIGAYKNTK